MTSFTVKRHALKLAVTAALVWQTGAALGAPREAGIWYDDTGKGAVKIEACGNKLCGRIYWLKDQLNAEGKPLRDKYNPNEGQRNRPICGLQVIGGLSLMQTGEWDSGWIYDPKEGKSYSVALVMTDAETLKVTGYLVMKMMGRTLTWKRAPQDLPACATNAAAASPAATAPAAKPKPSKVAAPLPPEEDAGTSEAAAEEPSAKAAAPAAAAPKAPASPAETPKADAKPKAKAAAKPADAPPAKSGKTAAKPAATKSAAKTAAEVLPWSDGKKGPAAGSIATTTSGTSTAEPAPVADGPDTKPVRQAAPDMQATFGAQ
jgi:uncharacterized protein (DUF2147 family)